MVAKMKWRPWQPASPTKKFEAMVDVRRLKGLCSIEGVRGNEGSKRLMVETKWKGSKNTGLASFGKKSKKDCTREAGVGEDGIVEWNEKFQNICNFSVIKDNCFHPWEVVFTVFKVLSRTLKNKVIAVGTASLDLAEIISAAKEELEINVQLEVPGKSLEFGPSLCLSLSLLELRTAQDHLESFGRSVEPLLLSPRSAVALKAGLRKVKKLTDYVTVQKTKKSPLEEVGSDGRYSARGVDDELSTPFDSDSHDDSDEGESEGVGSDSSASSFSYGTLAHANYARRSLDSNTVIADEIDDDCIYYSNARSSKGSFSAEQPPTLGNDESSLSNSKRNILSWRKRKLSFRSLKPKGEPLLKKHYGEEGGDDIDYDRRQFSLSNGWDKSDASTGNQLPVSEFGDDCFAVGSWELKEVVSRDGQMKLQTEVFLASIDQRSERAAGESACTALVAVLADWFQSNKDEMPIKCQFDSLIRDGSLEWRNLCENDVYKEQFPDRHFDLDTVLQAKIRPLSVIPEKSFVGFFHPEGLDEESFDFLQGVMSFDSIWDELESSSNGDPSVYIVSWNDHFFVLKVDKDAYYIIDTLGERFYEGCSQAYILKFDKGTTIQQLPKAKEVADEKPASDHKARTGKTEKALPHKEVVTDQSEPGKREEPIEEAVVLCRGKDSCKEYIKRFLAAIPVRELLADLKKGLKGSAPLHQRLQIEFHYTQVLPPEADFFPAELPITNLTDASGASSCIEQIAEMHTR